MKEKLISIIVPIYNCSKFLDICINSLTNQNYKNLEIILVNDGSKDNSLEICQNYKKNDGRIIIIDKENGGVSSARNAGLNIAQGDYILFVDADDFLDRKYVSTLYNFAINSDNSTMIMCNVKEFKKEEKFNTLSETLSNEKIIYKNNELFKLYVDKLLNPPYCKLYNRLTIVDNNIKFNESLSLGEDLLFNLDYIKFIERVIVIPDCLYNYRVGNNNSLSRKYYPNMLEIQDKLCSKFRSHFSNVDKKLLDNISLGFYMVAVSNELHKKDVGIINRYFNARKILKSNLIKDNIRKYKKSIGAYRYFLLKNNMIITYIINKKIVTKIKGGDFK